MTPNSFNSVFLLLSSMTLYFKLKNYSNKNEQTSNNNSIPNNC